MPKDADRRDASAIVIGVDIGGTFTDIVAQRGGEVYRAKVPSTRPDPSLAVVPALERILRASGGSPPDVVWFAHGTTTATNALIEGRVARVGLITTAGFRDVLAIGRQTRPELYNLFFRARPVPVDRELRLEVHERMDWRGLSLVAPARDGQHWPYSR